MFYMAGNMLKTYKPTNAILAIGGYLAGLHFQESSLHGKQWVRLLPSRCNRGCCRNNLDGSSLSDKIGKSRVGEYLAWMGRNSMVVLCMHFVTILVDPNTRLGVEDVFTWNLVDFMFIIPLTLVCTKMSLTRRIFMIR